MIFNPNYYAIPWFFYPNYYAIPWFLLLTTMAYHDFFLWAGFWWQAGTSPWVQALLRLFWRRRWRPFSWCRRWRTSAAAPPRPPSPATFRGRRWLPGCRGRAPARTGWGIWGHCNQTRHRYEEQFAHTLLGVMSKENWNNNTLVNT